jgi:hypothetical protein
MVAGRNQSRMFGTWYFGGDATVKTKERKNLGGASILF